MGAELSLLSPTAQTIAVSAYIDYLDQVQYSKPLSSTRFLKTIKCLDKEGSVVVKLLIKPTTELDLSVWVEKLEKLRVELIDLPNVLPFNSIIDSQRAGFLIRPYMRYNLYDRISIRPFLESIEKKWIVYQLLVALSRLHSKGIYHGDLKTENVLMTSWNWCLISDFALFKPVYLPENNPSQFSFFFDTSQRHTCYVAPERFLSSDEEILQAQRQEGQLTWQMDIFSLGCVIAELYLEGLSIFTLPQIFKYKKGEYQPNLDSIDDLNIRRLVQSMISVDPQERLPARDYLTQYRKTTFPDHFYTFLHPYVRKLSNSGDSKNLSDRFKECDNRVSRIYNDFDKIALYLGFKHLISEDDNTAKDDPDNIEENAECLIPLKLDLPGMNKHIPQSTSKIFQSDSHGKNDCSSLILLSIVLHNVRNTTHSSFRIQACDLILAFAEQLHDEAKLDRCLPYLIYMLDDPSEDVQSAALRSLTQLLTMVDVITPVNIYIFPEFILPKLQHFLKRTYLVAENLSSPSSITSSTNSPLPLTHEKGRYVRSVFAGCLPYLANVARKFYEMSSLFRNQLGYFNDPETENDFFITNDSLLNVNFKSLVKGFENLTIQILTDQDAFVRISLLKNILPLNSFFGKEKTNDVILSHLITYLNDRNPQIRLGFVSSIVSISIFVGIISLEQYILPLLVQSLNDPDELVVINVLKVFTELSRLGLIRKQYIWDLVKITIRLVLHPSEVIRQSVLNLIISIGANLSLADLYCMLYPIIRPFFQYEVTEFNWETLYICAHKPLSRAVYSLSKSWSLRQDPTLFWQRVENTNRKTDSISSSGISFLLKKGNPRGSMYRLHNQGADDTVVVDNSEVPLSQHDMAQVEKLKSVGLAENEMWKIATLRSYIFRVARAGSRVSKSYNDDEELKRMNILPRTVFFDVTHKSELIQQPQDNTTPEATPTLTFSHPSSFGTHPKANTNRRASSLLYGEIMKAEPSLLTNEETVLGGTSTATAVTTLASPGPASTFSDSSDLNFNDETLEYQKITTKIKHSYSGTNPYILRFLNSNSFEPTLDDYNEFGPLLKNIEIEDNQVTYETGAAGADQPSSLTDSSPQSAGKNGKSGVLISRLLEHKSAINSVVVSPDHKFFISGDEQGFLKVWDSRRLETNVTGSSSLSVNLGSPIIALRFLDNRHCFTVSTKDGYIKIFRIEFSSTNSAHKLRHGRSKLFLIRHYKLEPEDDYALQIEVSVSNEKPLIFFTTPTSKVMALDMRTMKVVMSLQNNLSHGIPTALAVDSKQTWALIGTSKGILDLWGLSFEVPLKSAKFRDSNYPIRRIKVLPSHYELNGKRNRFVAVIGGSGNSDMTIWDVSKLQPRQVLCSSSVTSTLETYIATDLSNESGSIEEELQALSISDSLITADKSCTALGISESPGGRLSLVCATASLKLIEWNLSDFESSRLITAGVKTQTLSDIPVFSSTQINSNLTFVYERYTSATGNVSNGTAVDNGSMRRRKQVHEQQEISKNHRDVVNDIVLLRQPYDMIVGVDRSGVINVYRH